VGEWGIVTFLLAGNDLFPVLLFLQEELPFHFLEILFVRATTATFGNATCDSFCTS
jgi:hypothetical protein